MFTSVCKEISIKLLYFSPQALREAHEQFKASLSAAEADFNQLAELDKQIKSFNVGPNPYTWFTMEALEETWRNLTKIIRVREISQLRGKTI
jgi:spectrin alpha